VIRRSDKVLLPPAQAMFDFIGSEGSNFLPDVPLVRRSAHAPRGARGRTT